MNTKLAFVHDGFMEGFWVSTFCAQGSSNTNYIIRGIQATLFKRLIGCNGPITDVPRYNYKSC